MFYWAAEKHIPFLIHVHIIVWVNGLKNVQKMSEMARHSHGQKNYSNCLSNETKQNPK